LCVEPRLLTGREDPGDWHWGLEERQQGEGRRAVVGSEETRTRRQVTGRLLLHRTGNVASNRPSACVSHLEGEAEREGIRIPRIPRRRRSTTPPPGNDKSLTWWLRSAAERRLKGWSTGEAVMSPDPKRLLSLLEAHGAELHALLTRLTLRA